MWSQKQLPYRMYHLNNKYVLYDLKKSSTIGVMDIFFHVKNTISNSVLYKTLVIVYYNTVDIVQTRLK